MKVIAKNKKANFDYNLTDSYMVGISLLGQEVKSIKAGDVSINESYVIIDKNNNLQILNMNVKKYEQGYKDGIAYDPLRTRQLLAEKSEIRKIKKRVILERMVIIPTKILINNRGLIKIEIKIGKPRKNYDKREYEKEKDFKKIKKEYI